ncbi:MAG: YkgJ family cysteine cluster protein [Gammaproteobacteria bacterium]
MKACNSCGKCCTKYGGGSLSATPAEIEEWEESRPDIFRYVSNGDIWCDPDTGTQLERCPFLYKNTGGPQWLCKIYADRPDDCRLYPSSVNEMVQDQCEMLERKDLLNPRRADKDLDDLMRDSWSGNRS